MSYTFALLKISREAYDEISRLLLDAGYQHAFIRNHDAIDMHGIALTPNESAKPIDKAPDASTLEIKTATGSVTRDGELHRDTSWDDQDDCEEEP